MQRNDCKLSDEMLFAMTRPKERGGVNPGRDLLTNPELVNRALDNSDMRENLLPLYSFIVGANAKRVLEIGTSDGTSTLALLKAAHEIEGHVTSIDISDVPVAEALVNHFQLRSRWKFIQGNSHDVLPRLRAEGNVYDFVFVDGDHSYEGALKDVIDVAAMLIPDGFLVLHDSLMMRSADEAGCGVVAHEILRGDEWNGLVLPFGCAMTILQRRRAGWGRVDSVLRQQIEPIAKLADKARTVIA